MLKQDIVRLDTTIKVKAGIVSTIIGTVIGIISLVANLLLKFWEK